MSSISEQRLLRKFLRQLGLTPNEERLYVSLVELGTASVLRIAQRSGVNRTTAYRILETLKDRGLVEESLEEHRHVFRLAGAHKIDFLIKEKETQLKVLKDLAPSISSMIGYMSGNAQPGTKVLFYRGTSGIRQMVWNTLRTKQTLVGYTLIPLVSGVGYEFAKDWHEEWMERDLRMRDIYSDTYLKHAKKEEFQYGTPYFTTRYISSAVLNVNYQVDIYNDVTAYYNWYGDEIFGVEIYNEKISKMQRQMFELVWEKAG